MLRWTLQGVQEQIKLADAKAGLVGLFHTILFGFIATQADSVGRLRAAATAGGGDLAPEFRIWVTLLLLYVLTAAAAMVWTIRSVVPRLAEGARNSLIYFYQIGREYGTDRDRYLADSTKMREDEWAADVASQILINSRIATRKHALIRRAALWTAAAVVLWAGTLVMATWLGHSAVVVKP